MGSPQPAHNLLSGEEQQRAGIALTNLEHRERLTSLALASALIVLTLAVATELANLVKDGSIRL